MECLGPLIKCSLNNSISWTCLQMSEDIEILSLRLSLFTRPINYHNIGPHGGIKAKKEIIACQRRLNWKMGLKLMKRNLKMKFHSQEREYPVKTLSQEQWKRIKKITRTQMEVKKK